MNKNELMNRVIKVENTTPANKSIVIEKRKLNKIHIFAFISSIIGFIIMIIAPGNYERSSMFNDNTFFIIKWIKRL